MPVSCGGSTSKVGASTVSTPRRAQTHPSRLRPWLERWRSGGRGTRRRPRRRGLDGRPGKRRSRAVRGARRANGCALERVECDPAGRLLVGTMALDYRPVGSLYSVEPDGSVRRLLGSLSIANGMAWTDDGATFYYIDSPLRRVDAFDYDLATGAIAGRRPYLTFETALRSPTGCRSTPRAACGSRSGTPGDPPLRAGPRARCRRPRAGDAGDELRLRRPGSP